ncbi:MaoC family dehydratase N-terminal domain-containing protein [Chloroflexota bacterium]
MINISAITDEMRTAIGTFPIPTFEPEEVTKWAIMRYAAATEDPNPLLVDEEYAKRTRWGGIVAPPCFAENFSPSNRCYREHGGEEEPNPFPFKLPFGSTYYANEDMEFLLPIRPRDTIYCKCVFSDVYEKESTHGAGKLIFLVFDKKYYNQSNEVVTISKWTEALVESPPLAALNKSPSVPGRTVNPAVINHTQIYFDDIDIGVPVPSMEKRISMSTIAKWAGASGDTGRVHFDHEFMKNVFGVPDVFAHGPLNIAYLAQLITNWIGDSGVLKKHSAQLRGNVFPGDIITFEGKVTSKYEQQKERFVECETWAKNQHNQKVTIANSTFTLPSRKRNQ